MAGVRAVQLYSLAVPADGEPVAAGEDLEYPATFRVTMAAIDPTEKLQTTKENSLNGSATFTGATLRIVRVREDSDDESDDDESFDMSELLDDGSDEDGEEDDEEDDDDEDDEEANGGPSDPSKSVKAKRKAALKAALAGVEEDMEIDDVVAKDKGKGKAVNLDEDEEDEDVDSDEDLDDMSEGSYGGAEEFVVCTLDPSKAYQQTLDITINEHEIVYFTATGTHTIYLTGNVLIPEHDDYDDVYDSDDEDAYDLTPDEDELDYSDESDELDDLEDPRVTELGSDEEDNEEEAAIPSLIPAKGKNKRALDDSELSETGTPAATVAKVNGAAAAIADAADSKTLSKTQLKKMRKKMKDNAGNAVDTTAGASAATVNGTSEDIGVLEPNTKSDKKVQFAKTLVQGPTGKSATAINGEAVKSKVEKTAADAPKVNGASKGARVVQGVTIDDRKLGLGPAAKKGDKVGMRYIGKLEKDKKVFDANKKGPPFTFKLGAGQVIKGWDIGLQGICVGGERRITIPAHLAYGSKSMPDIPANSTLIFDVKCLEIK